MSLAIVSRDAVLEPTRRRVDVREMIRDLHRRHPRMGVDGLADKVCDLLEEDRHLLLDAARALVRQIVSEVDGRERQRHAASAPVRAEREAANRAAVQKAIVQVKALVLDTVIAGKALRFHTGAEVALLGAGFVKLAERVPADCLVGEIVTESEAAALLCAPPAGNGGGP